MKTVRDTPLGDVVTTVRTRDREDITVETGKHRALDFADVELRVAAFFAAENPGADVWGPYSTVPKRPRLAGPQTVTGRWPKP